MEQRDRKTKSLIGSLEASYQQTLKLPILFGYQRVLECQPKYVSIIDRVRCTNSQKQQHLTRLTKNLSHLPAAKPLVPFARPRSQTLPSPQQNPSANPCRPLLQQTKLNHALNLELQSCLKAKQLVQRKISVKESKLRHISHENDLMQKMEEERKIFEMEFEEEGRRMQDMTTKWEAVLDGLRQTRVNARKDIYEASEEITVYYEKLEEYSQLLQEQTHKSKRQDENSDSIYRKITTSMDQINSYLKLSTSILENKDQQRRLSIQNRRRSLVAPNFDSLQQTTKQLSFLSLNNSTLQQRLINEYHLVRGELDFGIGQCMGLMETRARLAEQLLELNAREKELKEMRQREQVQTERGFFGVFLDRFYRVVGGVLVAWKRSPMPPDKKVTVIHELRTLQDLRSRVETNPQAEVFEIIKASLFRVLQFTKLKKEEKQLASMNSEMSESSSLYSQNEIIPDLANFKPKDSLRRRSQRQSFIDYRSVLKSLRRNNLSQNEVKLKLR